MLYFMMALIEYVFAAMRAPARRDARIDARSLRFDLQLFADDSPTGQKTEEATPHAREKAREQGRVAKSADLTAMITVLCGFLAVYYLGNYSLAEMKSYLAAQYSQLHFGFDELALNKMIIGFLKSFWICIGPVVFSCVAGAIIVSYYQVGFYFSFEPMFFDIGRLNPVNGIMKIFSKEPLIEIFKSFMKIAAVIYFPYSFFSENIKKFSMFMGLDAVRIIPAASPMIFDLAVKIMVVMIIIAVIDYYYQSYEFEKSIMMSKYDVQKEYKELEGNPQVKQEMRRRARQRKSVKKMLEEVPKAKVVVTNPTHYAVAIAYEIGTDAPKVVAKGTDFLAQKIREAAKAAGVTLHEDRPLARSLYETVEVGDAIPDEFYLAIANILAMIIRRNSNL